MTKKELITKVTEKVGKTNKTSTVINTAFDVIIEEVTAGNVVDLQGFGKFKTIERAERKGHNPRTGEEITIPARKSPVFTPSQTFKNAVNK